MRSNPAVFPTYAGITRCVFCSDAASPDERCDVYKTWSGEAERLVADKVLAAVSLHRYRSLFILYYECLGPFRSPEELFGADAADFRPMMDVYHVNIPEAESDWIRETPRHPVGRVNYLRPGKVSSYIFYHFQLQEECPGAAEMTFQISACENLLFLYTEDGCPSKKPGYKGLLNTKNTPPEGWAALMTEHFQPWPDKKNADDEWRDADTVFWF